VRLALAAIGLLVGGCIVVPAHAPRRTAPAPTNHAPGRPVATPIYAPAPQVHSSVVRAKEIRANAVRARVIYAKEVKARDGRVGRVFEGRTEEWERGRSDQELRGNVVEAEVIYAKEVRAEWIEAAEIHAKEVKIGR
jgi:hypothetical protein